jgi:hypothetical protein
MIRILINGEQIDLSEGAAFEQSFQAFDISNLTASKSDSTSSISAPYTNRNERIFGLSQGSNNNSSIRRSALRIDIIDDGTFTMANGVCVITSWNNEKITFNAYKGAIDLYKVIGNAELKELDMSDLDHFRNHGNIVNNRNTTSGYIYPILNFGKLNFDTNAVDTRYLLPALHTLTVVEKIIERSGFSVTGKILDNQRYKDDILPLTTVNAGDKSNLSLIVGRSANTSTALYSGGSFRTYVFAPTNVDLTGDDVVPCFRSRTFTGDGLPSASILSNASGLGDAAYTSLSSGRYRFTFTAMVFASNVSVSSPCKLKIYAEKGTGGEGSSRVLTGETDIFNGTSTYQVTTSFEQLEYLNHVIGVVEIPATASAPQEQVSILTSTLECIEVEGVEQHQYNSQYDVAVNMPDMSQVDFLKGVFAKFQLIPVVDTASGSVNLFSYNDAYSDLGLSVDYSGKVDMSSPVTRSHVLPGFARENVLKYSNEHKGIIAELYGSGTIQVDDESIAEERNDLIELPFTAPLQQYNALTGIIPVVALMHVIDTTTGLYDENVEGVRLLTLKRLSSTDTIVFEDDSNTIQITTSVSFGYFFYDVIGYESMGFDDTDNVSGIISSHYAGLLSLLDKSEIVKCSMRLSTKDIAGLDLTKAAYIKELGANYIINKIEGYRPGIPAIVELIRM